METIIGKPTKQNVAKANREFRGTSGAKVSISSTFWQQEIGAKATHKILVKLTEGYKTNFALKRQKFGQNFLLVLLLQFRSRYILL